MNTTLAILTVVSLGAIGGLFGGIGFGWFVINRIQKQITPKLDAYIEELKSLSEQ